MPKGRRAALMRVEPVAQQQLAERPADAERDSLDVYLHWPFLSFDRRVEPGGATTLRRAAPPDNWSASG
jgi:hypothetical protein